MDLLDISVIILTFNEEIHIRRLLDNIGPVAKHIFIIDSFSTDNTLQIINDWAQANGRASSPDEGEPSISVLQHKWENNHAKQFNWGLAEVKPPTEWIMRLDADEYLSPELIDRLRRELPSMAPDISGIELKLAHKFLGKHLKGGTGPVFITRLFRNGKAFCEERPMDERIKVTEGQTVRWEETFVDDNLNDLTWWTAKHNGYATREAKAMLMEEFAPEASGSEGAVSAAKRKKGFYSRLPLFWRAFAYFLYRYFARGGCLEGKRGFMWCFLQGWWYRTLVDAKIWEIKQRCGNDPAKIKSFLASDPSNPSPQHK